MRAFNFLARRLATRPMRAAIAGRAMGANVVGHITWNSIFN